MNIRERLQTEFPGITATISGFVNALRAYHAYNRALKDMEAFKIKDPVNAWIWNVSEHSMLSYKGAQYIYDYLSEHPSICKHSRNMITEFVIELASCGHTADMILRYLKQIDMEIKQRALIKLEMCIE
jgi:hypothetical protein